MKLILPFSMVLLLVGTWPTYGQSKGKKDSIRNAEKVILEKRLQIANSKLDSLNKATRKDSSANLVFDKTNAILNLGHANFDSLKKRVKKRGSKKFALKDSLARQRKIGGAKSDSLNSLLNATIAKKDSLKPKMYDSLRNSVLLKKNKVDSVQSVYQAKLNEISKLNLSPKKLNKKIEKLNQQQAKSLEKVNAKLASAQKKWNGKISERQRSIMKRLKPGMDSLGVNGKNQELGLSVGALNGKSINTLTQKSFGKEVGAPNTGKLGQESISMPGLPDPLKGVENPLEKITTLPQNELDKVKGMKEVAEIQGKISGIEQTSGQVKGYAKEIDSLRSGDYQKKAKRLAENEAKRLKGIEELDKQNKYLNELKAEKEKNEKLMEQYKDKAFMEKQLKGKAKTLATEQLEKQVQKVDEAMGGLQKYKSKFNEIQSYKDLPKRRPNEMKGKSLRERLEPGFMLEISRGKIITVYAMPQVSYKFSGRFWAGLGFTYRFQGTLNDSLKYYREHPVFGPKIIGQFNFRKGFYLRIEGESLNTELLMPDNTYQEGRTWVHGIFLGTGKNFSVNKTWKGDVQVLYNVLYKKYETPYPNQINLRFGFFVDLKKKKKFFPK
jgi:hypothetical protein